MCCPAGLLAVFWAIFLAVVAQKAAMALLPPKPVPKSMTFNESLLHNTQYLDQLAAQQTSSSSSSSSSPMGGPMGGPKEANATAPCPLRGMDVFVMAYAKDFPLVNFLLHSVAQFVPCRGTIHLLVDLAAYPSVFAWVQGNLRLQIHRVALPHDQNGHLTHMWLMAWADRFVSPSAEFIMFLDPDMVFALPATCRTLFDEVGRIYQVGWELTNQTSLKQFVDAFVAGAINDRSLFTTFPFLYPTSLFSGFRNQLSAKYGGPSSAVSYADLTAALLAAASKVSASTSVSALTPTDSAASAASFSTNAIEINPSFLFGALSEYMRVALPDRVLPIMCPKYDGREDISSIFRASAETARCENYVPLVFHYGRRHFEFVGVDSNRGTDVAYFRAQNQGEFSTFSRKFSVRTNKAVQEVMVHGYCLAYFANRFHLSPLCASEMTSYVPEELSLYGFFKQPDMELFFEKFKADDAIDRCPFVSP